MLNHWQEGPHYIGTHHYKQVEKKLERCLFHLRRNEWARTGAVFPCFVSAFRILQSDVMGDYLPQSSHDCDSPSDLQRSPGSWWVGKPVERRALPLRHWTAGQLVVSSSIAHIRELGPDLCLGACTRSVRPQPLAFKPSSLWPPPDLPRAPIKPRVVSSRECCPLSVILWFAWMAVCFSVEWSVQCSDAVQGTVFVLGTV